MNVNYFKTIKHNKCDNSVNLDTILQSIKNGKYSDQINQIREAQARNASKNELNDLKSKLPNFTLSGCFDKNRLNENFLADSYTKSIQIDFDNLEPTEITKIREVLQRLPYIYSVFLSPRGNGIKAIAKHTAEYDRHLEAFQYFEEVMQDIIGKEIDTQCKNISRVFYVSYDPDLYINANCSAVDIPKQNQKNINFTQGTGEKFENVFDFIKYHLEKNGVHFVEGNKSNFRMQFAKGCAVFGEPEHSIISYCETHFTSTQKGKELQDCKSGFKYGSAVPKKTFVPYSEYIASLPKNAKTKKSTQNQSKEDKEEKSSSMVIIFEECKDLFYRCSKTKRLYYNDSNKYVDEQELNSILTDLQIKHNVKKEHFFTFVKSNHIQEKELFKEYFETQTPVSGCVDSVLSSLKYKDILNADLYKSILKKWLLGIVAQVFEDSQPNIICPVLIGAVNNGKTSWFKQLFKGTFLNDYQTVQRMTGKADKDTDALFVENVCVLIDELNAKDFKDASFFRTKISQTHYRYRPPFATNATSFARLASLCGTSNETCIITDAKNNRRIVPIEMLGVDWELYNSVDKNALFGELYYEYINQNEPHTLSEVEIAFVLEISKEHKADGFEEYLILDIFRPATISEEGARYMSATDILAILPDTFKRNATHLGRVLEQIGFERHKNKTQDGRRLSSCYCVKLHN